MKIVVLDGYGLNPGDLSWNGFESLGDCTVYDRTPSDMVIERAREAEIVLTNKTVLSASHLEQLPLLRYIGVLATGYNVVDTEAATLRGIVVTNIPAYSTDSVAQLVFAHLLNIASQVGLHSEAVRAGAWSACPDFCFWKTPIFEIAGKTIGIVGLGNIGNAVARIAHAFGMNVIASTGKRQDELPEYITAVDRETLWRESDVISLHCPLTPNTKHLINAETLRMMKPTAILINTGLKRGTYPCRRYRCIIDRATGSRQSVADRPQLLHHAAHCMGNTRSENPIDTDRRRESEIVFKRHSGKPGKLKTSDTNDKRPLEHKVQRAFVVMYFLIRKDTFHRQKQVRQPNIRAMQSMRSSSNTTRSSSFPIP